MNPQIIITTTTAATTAAPAPVPAPVTVQAKPNEENSTRDLAAVDKGVSEFKGPAWRRYAGAKLVGTVVSAAGVIAGGVGSLAMGLDPSLGAIACLAAPVIKYTIDRIFNEGRIGPFQETINATIRKATVANSWVEQLIPIKALINMVEKFKDSNVPKQCEIVGKLRTEADRITAHIKQQHPFEASKVSFPVSQKEIQDLKWAGTDVSRLINSVFYVGAIASNCLFYNEMVTFGNTIAAWGWVVELKEILIK